MSNQLQINRVINTTSGIQVNSVTVLGSQVTGWTSVTGIFLRGAYDTATITGGDVIQVVGALINDLKAHGIIGT